MNNITDLQNCEYKYKFWRIFDVRHNKEMQTFPCTYTADQIKTIMIKFFNERYKSNEPYDLKDFNLEWCFSPGLGCFEKHIFVCNMQELLNR